MKSRSKKTFYKLVAYAESLGINVDIIFFKSRKEFKWGGTYSNSNIVLNILNNNRINWTSHTICLAHELGHHFDDIKRNKKEYIAHSFLLDDKGSGIYIPMWARKVILNSEFKAESYVPMVLERAGIQISDRKIKEYAAENIYMYIHLLNNKGKYPTNANVFEFRRKLKSIIQKEIKDSNG